MTLPNFIAVVVAVKCMTLTSPASQHAPSKYAKHGSPGHCMRMLIKVLVIQETDRIMEEMYQVLQQHQTVGWLELVMNHKDFSQTVENIFTLSFLVRAQITPKSVHKMQCDNIIALFVNTSVCTALPMNYPVAKVKIYKAKSLSFVLHLSTYF